MNFMVSGYEYDSISKRTSKQSPGPRGICTSSATAAIAEISRDLEG